MSRDVIKSVHNEIGKNSISLCAEIHRYVYYELRNFGHFNASFNVLIHRCLHARKLEHMDTDCDDHVVQVS